MGHIMLPRAIIVKYIFAIKKKKKTSSGVKHENNVDEIN